MTEPITVRIRPRWRFAVVWAALRFLPAALAWRVVRVLRAR